jgi:hypothetical protein
MLSSRFVYVGVEWLAVGLAVAKILLRTADNSDAADAIVDIEGGWSVLRASRRRETALGKTIAQELERQLTGTSGAVDDLRAAAQDVSDLLSRLAEDDDSMLAAARYPDKFLEYVNSHGGDQKRRLISQHAVHVFDRILEVATAEFARLAPSSKCYAPAALTEILRQLPDIADDAHMAADYSQRAAEGIKRLNQFVEDNKTISALDPQSIEKLAEVITSFRYYTNDDATREAVAGILTMTHAKNVLHAAPEDEVWAEVFESLRELRDALAATQAKLKVTGPKPVESALEAMLTLVRNYLARHKASFTRHMANHSWHAQADWPGLPRAALELLALREAVEALSAPLNSYARNGDQLPSYEVHSDAWDFGWGTVGDLRNQPYDRRQPKLSWEVLLSALQSELPSIRLLAIDHIATSGSRKATQELMTLLADPDEGVRSRAALALRTMPRAAPRA